MGFWVGNTPKKLFLYKERGEDIVLPYGTLSEITNYFYFEFGAGLADWEYRIKKCSADYKGAEIPLYDYQEDAVRALKSWYGGILQAPAGSGKGLPLDAKIYTPNGYVRNGDLKVGDEVCNSYGGVSKVTGIYDRGMQKCYRITFTDDTSVVCDDSHLWTVREVRKDNGKWITVDTETIFKSGVVNAKGERLYEIPVAKPVEFNAKEISIDPWLLGALLGDGTFCGNGVSFSNNEKDVIERVNLLSGNALKYKGKYDYYFADGAFLKYALMDYGLYGKRGDEKFIPKDYIYNSVDVRLAVLQGLMDTDGSVSETTCSITSTSKRLIDECLEIVQSLGGTGRISCRKTKYTYNGERREGKESYRMHFKLYDFLPFSSEKHMAKYRPREKYTRAYRRIKSVEQIGSMVTRCISVDSEDNLYLTDGYVVTHNTQMGIAFILERCAKALWLTHTKDLLNQSYDRAAQYIDKSLLGKITEGKVQIGSGITFATVQTMANMDLEQFKREWEIVIVDECHRAAGSPSKFTQFGKVLNALSANKYGLSATVHRADGMIEATYAMLGHVVYSVPEEATRGKVMQVKVMRRDTGVPMHSDCQDTDGTLLYGRLIDYLCSTKRRNRMIALDLIENREHYNLILSDRIAHLKLLWEMLPADLQKSAFIVDGKTKAEVRNRIMDEMREGKIHFLFASYKLAKEGLDIPRLDRLYLTTPQKDYAIVTQSVGRIARTFEGKGEPVAYDYVDDIRFCEHQYAERKKSYKKLHCKIQG